MRLKQCVAISFLFSVLFSCIGNSALAAEIYRHVPFNISINVDDTLVVNYDFSEKNGVRCTASDKVSASFTYKGREKETNLPVILESSHVPDPRDKDHKELADVDGQFTLVVDKNQVTDEKYHVSCSYVE